jgi:hypothetical protein
MNKTLKLEHRVYVYDQAKDEVLCLIVKGGSTSHKDPKDKTGATYVRPFTDYLSGDAQIPFIIETVLSGKPFKTSTGTKYYISMAKSRDLTEDEVSVVATKTLEVLNKLNGGAAQPEAPKAEQPKAKAEEDKILEDFGVNANIAADPEDLDSGHF